MVTTPAGWDSVHYWIGRVFLVRVAIEVVIEFVIVFVIVFVIAFVIVLLVWIHLGSLLTYSSSTLLLCARMRTGKL